jgi:hypothetical protein
MSEIKLSPQRAISVRTGADVRDERTIRLHPSIGDNNNLLKGVYTDGTCLQGTRDPHLPPYEGKLVG